MTHGPLSPAQRSELLASARRTLEVFLATGQRPVIETRDAALLEPAGAFVSLHERGPDRNLRGCIGTFEADAPVIDTVGRMAIAAATSDPRFESVTSDELSEIQLEISVLSPRRRGRIEEIEIGVHGLQVTRHGRRGVLLPQVAVEQRWDVPTFVAHTCLKAGLPMHAWQDPATVLELFTAQVFGEGDPTGDQG